MLRLEGFAASVEARTRALCDELRLHAASACSKATRRASCWRALASAAALAASPVVWRISVPPADALRVLERLEPERYLLDWGGGLISRRIGASTRRACAARCTSGHATLLKAPAAARAATPRVPAASAGRRRGRGARLRSAFDPRGILNPGRMG